MTAASITARERAQIDDANASDAPVVVLIHTVGMLASSWDPWRDRLAERGYSTVAVEWPGEPASFEDALARPMAVAGVGLKDVLAHVMLVIRALDQAPFVVGHSFGGLIAQQIAGRGESRGTVAITPPPMKGAAPPPRIVLRAAMPVLADRANRSGAVRFAYSQYRFGWANAVAEEEARRLYETHHVPVPGLAVFEVAAARFENPSPAVVGTITPDRGPLLVIAAGEDRMTAPEIAADTYRIQRQNPCPTELVEFPDRGHTLTFDSGWADVADRAIDFLDAHVTDA